MYNSYSSSVITNCTFAENTAGRDGGGMRSGGFGNPLVVVNTIFWGNTAAVSGDKTHIKSSDIISGDVRPGNTANSNTKVDIGAHESKYPAVVQPDPDPDPVDPPKPDPGGGGGGGGTPVNVEPVKAQVPAPLPETATEAQKTEAIEKVAETLPTLKPADFEIVDGVVTVNRELAITLANENVGGGEVVDMVGFPIFTAELATEGDTAMMAFEVIGSDLFASLAEDVILLKVQSSSTSEFFTYTSTPSEFSDKCFTVMDAGDNIVTEIQPDVKYKVVLFIADGQEFDLNGATDGTITDPVAIIKLAPQTPPVPNPEPKKSSGGGCNAGWSTIGILLTAAFSLPLRGRWRAKRDGGSSRRK